MPKELRGFVVLPREWLRQSSEFSDRAFRLHQVMVAMADWDARHSGFGTLRLSHGEAKTLLSIRLSRATYWRALKELEDASAIQILGGGTFRVIGLSRFLLGKAKTAALKIEGVSPERRTASPKECAVSQVGPTASPMKQSGESSDDDSALKQLKLPKESKAPNGDSLYPWECERLPTKARLSLMASLGRIFGSEKGDAEALIATYHAKRVDRGLSCESAGCFERVLELASRSESAALNRIAYFRKGLLNLAEQATDEALGAKEAGLMRRPRGSDEFARPSDFNSIISAGTA